MRGTANLAPPSGGVFFLRDTAIIGQGINMAKIEVDKISAARRQINAAIRMLFSDEDPIAIHTVASAGFRILKDLAEKQDSEIMDMFNLCIRPEMRKKFWGGEGVNRAANFFKHADKDPEQVLKNIDETVNDHHIFWGCLLYQDILHRDPLQTYTNEMGAFIGWYSAMYPDCVRDDLPWSHLVRTAFVGISDLSRPEQLAQGQLALMAANRTRKG